MSLTDQLERGGGGGGGGGCTVVLTQVVVQRQRVRVRVYRRVNTGKKQQQDDTYMHVKQ